MPFNFDEVIDRRGTGALAKDGFRPYLFSGQPPVALPCEDDDALSMWVADMAFASAPAARQAMVDRIDRHPIVGYSGTSGSGLQDAFVDWCRARYGWEVDADHIVTSRGVVPALYSLAEIYLQPGQTAVTLTPAYGYFRRAPTERNRMFVSCGLFVDDTGQHRLDLDDLASKLARPDVALFYLCHPHNPTGKRFTADELRTMGELCATHDVLLVSDEIHCDLLRSGLSHTPTATVVPEDTQIITCMSTSKTFNLAGLGIAQIVIPNDELRLKWANWVQPFVNPISLAAAVGVLRDQSGWHAELLAYLDGNFAHLKDRLATELPDARFSVPEATYLAWIDLSHYFSPEENLTRHFAESAGLILEGGDMFVSDAIGWVRLNLACPRSTLDDGISRLVAATTGPARSMA